MPLSEAQKSMYTDILRKEEIKALIMTGFFVCMLAGMLILLAVWWRRIAEDSKGKKRKKSQKNKQSKQQAKSWKFEIAEWCVALVAAVAVSIGAIGSQIRTCLNCSRDIREGSFVVYSEPFTARREQIWVWKGPNRVEYWLILTDGTEILLDANTYPLTVGEHTDLTLVYAKHSGILLELFEIDQTGSGS